MLDFILCLRNIFIFNNEENSFPLTGRLYDLKKRILLFTDTKFYSVLDLSYVIMHI